jgi:hypothetical protein
LLSFAGLIDPALPLLIAGATAATVFSGVVGSTVVIPRLKQLPEPAVRVEGTRQMLLAQVNLFCFYHPLKYSDCASTCRPSSTSAAHVYFDRQLVIIWQPGQFLPICLQLGQVFA